MQTHSQSLSCSRIYIRRRPMYSLKILGVLLTEQPRAVFWSVTKSPRNRRKHFRGQHTAGGKQSPSDWFHARRRAKCRSINNNNNKKQLRIFLCVIFFVVHVICKQSAKKFRKKPSSTLSLIEWHCKYPRREFHAGNEENDVYWNRCNRLFLHRYRHFGLILMSIKKLLWQSILRRRTTKLSNK